MIRDTLECWMPKLMGSGSFRADLALPEQRQLFDYWQSLLRNGAIPCRSDFRPSSVARLLPSLTLIDVAKPLAKSRIRLAGTKIVEFYGSEITGRSLHDLGWEQQHDYWLNSIDKAATHGEPAAGIIQGPTQTRSEIAHYWLRLPLRNLSDMISIVLCQDIIVPLAGQNMYRRIVTI